MTNVELNEAIDDGSINELIRVAEARQCKELAWCADDICREPDVRLVLLAGASAAGKTTTAKRLCTQLRVNDRTALHLSTDDYFVGDDQTPRDEKGHFDYEHVDCVDIPNLVADINALLQGEAVPVRRFDFEHHRPYTTEERLTLPADGIIVLEGIHALNPRLTEGVPPEAKCRAYVEPKPSLDIFGGITPTPAEARFLRRMVRDNHFRKITPERTVEMWPNVLAGEKKWIEPYRGEAEYRFDSYLVYELAVLKPYVGGLLERARRVLGDRPEIVNMIRLLAAVDCVSPTHVPGDSILRETIGGSLLEY